jgi:hypothetical protein
MKTSETIPVGVVHSFEPLMRAGGYGVWRKTYQGASGRVTYIIARVPPVKAYSEPPSSALTEFSEESEALSALTRWRQESLSRQRIRRKKEQPDQSQFELGLEPYKSKKLVSSSPVLVSK